LKVLNIRNPKVIKGLFHKARPPPLTWSGERANPEAEGRNSKKPLESQRPPYKKKKLTKRRIKGKRLERRALIFRIVTITPMKPTRDHLIEKKKSGRKGGGDKENDHKVPYSTKVPRIQFKCRIPCTLHTHHPYERGPGLRTVTVWDRPQRTPCSQKRLGKDSTPRKNFSI